MSLKGNKALVIPVGLAVTSAPAKAQPTQTPVQQPELAPTPRNAKGQFTSTPVLAPKVEVKGHPVAVATRPAAIGSAKKLKPTKG